MIKSKKSKGGRDTLTCVRLIIVLLLLVYSVNSNAGFCDSDWSQQAIKYILVHNNVAYINIEPGLNDGNDAAEATLRTEVALVLTGENKENVYPLILAAFFAQKNVAMMYCDGTMTHGYKGGSSTVVKLRSLRVYN